MLFSRLSFLSCLAKEKSRMVKIIVALVSIALVYGCQRPEDYIKQADDAAYAIIAAGQHRCGVDDEGFSISQARQRLREKLLRDQHLPTVADAAVRPDDGSGHQLSLLEALQVGAYNSREYQSQKEKVFRAALALDLEREEFRTTFNGLLSGLWSSDKRSGARESGVVGSAAGGIQRSFESGAAFAASVGLDMVRLLTGDRVFARGIVADTSISVPLLRGSDSEIVTEPLQQAERDVVYAIWEFERFRRRFAVQIASEYLLVLEQMNRVDTARDNYHRLRMSRRRARRLADAGRLPEIQVDQALQDELRARSNWVKAQQRSADAVDRFKLTLGLPTDARIRLKRDELERIGGNIHDTSADIGAMPDHLLATALQRRRDLLIAVARVEDSRRAIKVAEDNLRGDITLFASGSSGARRGVASAHLDDSDIDPDRGYYSALLSIDLPLERTAERNVLRNRLIDYRKRQRDRQQLEDEVKYQVRAEWRALREAYENMHIQNMALKVARRRVASTTLLLQAGRIQMRDLLEAQDDLVQARNAVDEARVRYRIKTMELRRDLGTLTLDAQGKWLEDVVVHERTNG